MKTRCIVLYSLFSQLIVSAGAEAQTTTLFYQSTEMTGTSDYLAAGATGLTTAPIVGSVSGTLVFTGSLAAGDLDVTSYDFTFFGNNGSPVTVDAPAGPGPGVIVGNGQFFGLGTNFSVTTANGAIIGGSGTLVNEGYHTSTTALTIGSTGDAFQYQYATVDGSCQNQIGVTAKDPCDVDVSSSAAGVWTVQTAPVPLPPSIWLLLSAMGPISWVTYRSKRAAYQAAQ